MEKYDLESFIAIHVLWDLLMNLKKPQFSYL